MPQVNKAEDHIEVISWLNAAIFDDHQMKPLQFPPQSQPGMNFLRYKQIGLRAICASLGCVIGVLYYAIMINTTALSTAVKLDPVVVTNGPGLSSLTTLLQVLCGTLGNY